MYCTLSFQFVLNFGNYAHITKFQVILRVQLLRPNTVKCEQYRLCNKALLIIYSGVDIEKKLLSVQRIILPNSEII